MTRCSVSPVAGSTVNMTPARIDWIWRWTTTAMSMSAWPKPALGAGRRPCAPRTATTSSGARRRRRCVGAADVEEGLVHPRERGRRGVLGGGGRPDRNRHVGAPLGLLVGPADRPDQPLRHRLGLDHLADLPAGHVERGGVVDVDAGEALLDAPAEAVLVAEGGVGRRTDDEAGRDGQPRRGHLTEVGSLAARERDVLPGELPEGPDCVHGPGVGGLGLHSGQPLRRDRSVRGTLPPLPAAANPRAAPGRLWRDHTGAARYP